MSMKRMHELRKSDKLEDQVTAIIMDPWSGGREMEEQPARAKARAVLNHVGKSLAVLVNDTVKAAR